MSSKRGMLVVLEGLDRSGKSTQCKRLADNLRNEGENIYHTRFPNRETTTGQMISSYLGGQIQQDDHAIHLLFSANRWESAQEIEQRIESGTTVIIDRYYYSGCVYSAAKQNPSMDLAWCRHPEVGLPRPDLCVFLDISSNEAAKRGGFGQERYERQDLQDRVRELYKKMMQHDDEYEDIVTIDAGRSFEEVEKAVLQVVTQAKTRIDQKGNDLRYVRPW